MENKYVLDWNLYIETARQTVAEGCVLLKNDNSALPFEKGCKISLFGRIQNHYYKSGTGSGGMVNVTKVTNIPEGLRESGTVQLNEELAAVYAEWEKSHPYDTGIGWGSEPWSQEEMPLDDETVRKAADSSDAAVIIIGRTAGEDRDNTVAKGAYLLTDTEEDMFKKVCANFKRVAVILNTGGIMDLSFIDNYSPSAVLMVWQGGMTGGSGIADILTGAVSPSGKLSDTIAYDIADYPSTANFGDDERNFYCEDIYVGYRYFETFAKDKVRYPFGYGLSYTSFDIKTINADISAESIKLAVSVKNTGAFSGKEVVQIYVEAPQGKLGKPLRSLISFRKTDCLAPNDEQILYFNIDYSYLASYDDSGATGNKSCYVLEEGTYYIYAGADVRSAVKAASFDIAKTIVTEQLEEVCAPVIPFERYRPEANDDGSFKLACEGVPLATFDMDKKRIENLPAEISYTGDAEIKLADVLNGTNTMENFIAQLSDGDLSCIIRGEGMGSPKVTPGTAAAFGGISDKLKKLGIPAGCCDDGPSGLRLDCGTKAFSLPNGTLIACTFNTELVEKLFTFTGMEICSNKVECLLGPGMNIHRSPLNGRNFEYFSEDPYLTGIMASAELNGLHKCGVTGTIKHFCGNNQEHRRHFTDSVVSERALREIYLRGFEIAVKIGKATSVMTTYGALNGLWTAGCYDLNTTVLRKEWGFDGIVMTDWFASINERNKPAERTNFAAMIRSQNDLYMVCPDASRNSTGDNALESLADGTLTRGELQRSAMTICNFLMHTRAMERLLGNAPAIEILNRPAEDDDISSDDVEFITVKDSVTIPLTDKPSTGGTYYIIALDIEKKGRYKISLTGSSTLGELAQIPCTLFYTGIPFGTFTFNGTGGKDVTLEKNILLCSRFAILRLSVAQNGVDLKNIRFDFTTPFDEIPDEEKFMV
ncbi:MAG: glycoside hydrolase family 3 protein [Oscillospiraceae bacterium]|nr:glycoside hydrolase family 3 protein [Oscillospiraceae bacterium]